MKKATTDGTGELPRPPQAKGHFAKTSVVSALLIVALSPSRAETSNMDIATVRSGVPSVGIAGLTTIPKVGPSGDTIEVRGSFAAWVDGRIGHNSSSTRQDWDAASDLDLHVGPRTGSWSADLLVRGTADLDGRRPAGEPGIYNGILETFDNQVQPWLYRASLDKKLDIEIANLAEISGLRLGRQYNTDGDFLWFDGLKISGKVPTRYGRSVTGSIFGGVPVRLYESATDDWLAGGNILFGFGSTRIGLEGYHVNDRDRFGVTRKDNVGRITLSSALTERLRVNASGRLIDGEEFDGRLRFTAELPHAMRLNIDGRYQNGDRGRLSNEVDAASLIFGRAIGAPRRAYSQYGGDLFIPISKRFSLDIGGLVREARNTTDTYNLDYDRFFATFAFSDLEFFQKKTDLSLTLEAYETLSDWTRTASGEARMQLTRTLTGSLGTSYAIYRYDYVNNTVDDNVRIGTAKLEWRPRTPLTFELRYDGEDDDQRIHHFVRMGARYDF